MANLRREHFPDTLLALGEWGVEPKGDIDSTCDQAVARDPMYQLAAAAVKSCGSAPYIKLPRRQKQGARRLSLAFAPSPRAGCA